jgi:hypothetical protein
VPSPPNYEIWTVWPYFHVIRPPFVYPLTSDGRSCTTQSIEPANTLMDSSSSIDRLSPAEAKIRLFRSLFRGREDIYARRFESRKTGKSGYAPACANEWVRGICEKPRIKCAECPHRRFLAVADDVIRWHLSGFDAGGEPFVAGIYPLLPDETCWFLAIDFASSQIP